MLIDAGNLDLPTGTGIQTYSRTLNRALRSNGLATDFLFGRNLPADQDATVSSVAFFAHPPVPTTPFMHRWRQVQDWRLALLNGRRDARLVLTAGIVSETGATALPERVFNVADLYRIALMRHRLTRRFTTVRLPEKVDIFHLTYPWPVRVENAKLVVTIHDLVPLRLPYTTRDDPAEIVARHRKAVQDADLIVTVSEASKTDIVNMLGVPDERIAVTYQTSDLQPLSRAEHDELPRNLARWQLHPGGYILFVGAIEPKKNLRRLIEAFFLTRIDIPLVIAGPRAWMVEQELAELQDAGQRRVKILGYVARDDLRNLYAGASAFVYPSLYEGFGLPVLEALSFGLPILTSDRSSLPEIAGPAALYVDPFDRRGLREALEALDGNADLRGRLKAAAKPQAALFSPLRYRQRLAEAYAMLA